MINFEEEIKELAQKSKKELYEGITSLATKVIDQKKQAKLKTFYELHHSLDVKQDNVSRERRVLQRVLALVIRESLVDEGLIFWSATFGDAWMSFFFADRYIPTTFDGDDNILHLFSRKKDIDFHNERDRLLPIYQKNILLLFKKNANGETPCDLLKQNPNYEADSKFNINRIFESYAEFNAVLSGIWKRCWNKLLGLKSEEIIQAALREDPSLILPYHADGEEQEETLINAVDLEHRDFLAEQLLIHWCEVSSRTNMFEDEIELRKSEIEATIIEGYLNEHDPLSDLRRLVDEVQKKNDSISVYDLKNLALNIKSKLAENEYTKDAAEIRSKAMQATWLSILLIGIPFAFYYWRKFKNITKKSPVHVFEMTVSTYSEISAKLTFEKNGTINVENDDEIFGKEDNLKRAIEVFDEYDEEFKSIFTADNIKSNTRLRVVCADGDQTERFQDHVDSLSLLDRLTVSRVL